MISQGIRIENIAYSTDFNVIPDESFTKLKNLDIWIIDCIRYSYSTTHSYLRNTLMLINKVRPKLSILTHMGHEIEYATILRMLPKNVITAYDNVKISM